MPDLDYSVIMTEATKEELETFLLRTDEREKTWSLPCTRLRGVSAASRRCWVPSYPRRRGPSGAWQRELQPGFYVERMYAAALATGQGVALLHSHLGPGWGPATTTSSRISACRPAPCR